MAWKRAKLWNKSLWRWIIPVNIISLAYCTAYINIIIRVHHHRRICLHYCYFTYPHTRARAHVHVCVQLSYNFISSGRLSPVSDISFGITRRKIILSKLPSLRVVQCKVSGWFFPYTHTHVRVFSPINAAKSRATNFQ